MATSFSTRATFSSSLKSEGRCEKDRRKSAHEDRKTRKRARDTHRAGLAERLSLDSYSFAHLANVLVSGERIAMLNAVDRLRGRSRILVELASFSNFQFVRLAAVTHLSQDTEALVHIAKYCEYADTRAAALDELSTNNEGLVEAASSSLFKDTRLDAVALISNPNSLAMVAARSPNNDSRTVAIARIATDTLALKKVSEESPYRNSRLKAMSMLSSDADVLCSLVAGNGPLEIKRSAAAMLSGFVEEIEDVDAITEVANLSPNQDARYLAVGRLWRHPWALRKVISDSRFADSKATALMLLSDMVSSLDDPDLLSEVAMLSPYEDCRAAAVDRLIGQSSALLTVASKAKFKDSRDKALEKLRGDVESLKNVSRLSKYRDTRKQAHRLVADPEVFKGELARILG